MLWRKASIMSRLWNWKIRILVLVLFVIAVLNGELTPPVEEQSEHQSQTNNILDAGGAPTRSSSSIETLIQDKQKRISSPPHPNVSKPTISSSRVSQQTASPQSTTRKTIESAPAKKPEDVVTTIADDWTPKLGERLEAQWGSSWYPAKIISVESDGTFEIHFTKYPDTDTTYDEVVAVDRLRPTEQPSPSNTVNPTINVDIEGWEPQLGEQVQAKWGSSWYPAKIIRIDGEGKYSIHFTRYADSDTTFDESVTLERLKPATEK